ncbi:MAG: zinc finger protein [Saprospiraceae bacterium]
MGIYVGRWDCDYCGNVGNLGPHVHCSACGSSRPEDVVFYMPRGVDSKVTDEDQIAEAKEGANWVCAFCNNSNRNSYKACVSCGAMQDDSEKSLEVREFTESAVPRSSQPTQKLAAEKPKPRKSYLPRVLVFIAIIAFGYIGLSQISSTIDVKITQLEWERSIEVESYEQVTESDWKLPQGGKLISQKKEIHHYDRKITGYETRTRTVREAAGTEEYVCGKRDLGNGYFEDKYCTRTIYRDKTEEYEEPIYQKFPVYKTKYTYQIYRWKPFKDYKSSGQTKKVSWADVPAFVDNDAQKYRIKAEKEAYFFEIEDHKGRQHWYETNYDYWKNNIFVGKVLKAEKSTFFGYFKGLKDESKVGMVER